MNTLPIGRYRFFQAIQPLSLLTKVTSQFTNGCLQVFSTSGSWSFYFDEGKLIYACCAEKMFTLLYRNLQRLSRQIPTLNHAVYKQLRAIFEVGIENQALPNADYIAICWLVGQKYITHVQAGRLIEQLALEVMASFLKLKEGSYEFTPQSFLDDMPKFCHLDQFLLVEHCHQRSRNPRHTNVQSNVAQQQRCHNSSQQTRQSTFSHGILPPRLNTNGNSRQLNQQPTVKKLYKVFCVDNSPILLSHVKSCLDEQFFSFIGLNSSTKALMQTIQIKPDLILLDTETANLNGYEVCSLLRKHTYCHDIPVILMTERPSLVHRFKAKIVQASGSITKPFTQADLLKVIFQHIN